MKTRLKRMISLITFVVLISAIFSACGQTKDNPTNTGTVSNESIKLQDGATEPGTGEPAELHLFNVYFRHNDVSTDNFIIKQIESKTNTKLKIDMKPIEQSEEKLNIYLASGERPDIIQYGVNTTEKILAESNILLPVNQYFEKMPNLVASRTQKVWDAMTHKDGNIYAIPPVSPSSEYVTMYRKDWLDKFSLKIPETLDEYFVVADAVSNKDPDGDGEKDTYAFGARGSLGSYFDHVFNAYGCLPNYWMERDGQLVNGFVVPEAKEAVKFLKKMYDAGMIDPEFTTDNSERLKNKGYQGRFGAFHYGCYILDTANIYNHYESFKKQNPDGEFVAGPLLKGPSGTSFGYRNNTSIRGWVKTSILKETKELDACLRLIEYLASDEAQMLLNYGIENEHYAIDANNVVKTLIDGEKSKLLGINECVLLSTSLYLHTSKIFQDTMQMITDNAVPDPTDIMDNIPELEKYAGDLKDLMTTAFFKMIIGDTPIDGGFEDAVQQWKKIGGDELTNAVNAEYQKSK